MTDLRRWLSAVLGVCAAVVLKPHAADSSAFVQLEAVPAGELQAEAATADGMLHLLTFAGDPAAGNLLYRKRSLSVVQNGETWSAPVRVNSVSATAIAAGTVRGGHLAVAAGRVHAAWMSADREAPGMLYARSDDAGGFTPQMNVTQHETGLDGGGSLAADSQGNVYVAWHAGHDGERTRQLFVAVSRDAGRSFAAEIQANPIEAGACGCCGMRAGVSADGTLNILYRAATELIHRDMQWLTSTDGGRTFAQRTIAPWELAACPMSTAAIAASDSGAVLAWETAGQIHWSIGAGEARAANGPAGNRKHPAVARDAAGRVALVWVEGTGWNRGGDLAWQVYDPEGDALDAGRLDGGVPTWSRAAVVARPGGGFLILH